MSVVSPVVKKLIAVITLLIFIALLYVHSLPKAHIKMPTVPPPKSMEEHDLCTITNPLTNGFINLRELGALGHDGLVTAWNSKGFDYHHNFTLGICSTPFKQPAEVRDVSNSSLVGGYYTNADGTKFSIGEYSAHPKFRGRKLTLTYENGSYCSASKDLRKSTILSFVCDREIMAKAQVSFVGQLHDCAYYFEVRTVHACPTFNDEETASVAWVFFLLILVAAGVFFGAGHLYQLIRKNARRMAGTSADWKPTPVVGVADALKQLLKPNEKLPL
ncbi:hypothetical protein BABINDRAFT_162988 [Babjeviella inositovora NRRL Y-12698]|uniref:MRH domain-containing protein n=1 Tax=Babjeviella inositovora NRRL Y-12698 TaxID=984486 RepID=A0A1E3QJS2_9ASCO|nr:uncharacterized protein BABINDRAFT_162988 [Babjeviella inositovora NRRL Y-12698]ODQ77935.1 hypothetical protein BABINDRAFT_162988 [Babjeviella inositovora NRRL Y-12698]